jgi:hypothetical protein
MLRRSEVADGLPEWVLFSGEELGGFAGLFKLGY